MRKLSVKSIVAGIWALLILSTISCGNNSPVNQPNVVLILADDLGWGQLGCYNGPYETPSINALASQGLRFTDAYSSAAVCSPTRAALMTGKYPARLHITDFIKGNESRDSLLVQPEWQKYLPLAEITLAELFRENGYTTGIIGKWHLSQEKAPPESLPFNPDKQGFDEYMVTYKPVRRKTDPEKDPHNVDSITRRSIQFLETHRKEPFFLVISHNSIHDPVMESEEAAATYLTEFPEYKDIVNPFLGAMVERLDKGTGDILQALADLDLEENTIVIFASDNGGKHSYAPQAQFRMGKGWLYEGGIRVPLIIRWPDLIKPGQVTSTVTSSIDLFPTLLDLVGIDRPVGIDGTTLAPELLGLESDRKVTQYWHYPHYHRGSGMKPASAIRRGNYKLIEWHEELLKGDHAWELFDLANDPGETTDLSLENPRLLEDLRKDLYSWRSEVQAQMPALKNK